MKVIFRLNTVFILLLAMASSCQSSRLPVWFPYVPAYHTEPTVALPPNDTVAENTTVSPPVPEQPVLTAALPVEKEVEAHLSSYTQKLPTVKSFSKSVAHQAYPDTIGTQRTARPTIEQMRDGDKLNAIVHTIGGVLLAIGVILIIVALTASFPGWGALAALVYGVVALFISLPFILFRSSKSTNYVLEQEARAARKASKGRK